MKNTFRVLLSLAAISYTDAFGGCPVEPRSNPDDLGKQVFANRLNGFFQCNPNDPVNDKSPCNWFVGRALAELYNINDFKTDNGFVSANAMAAQLSAGVNGWKIVGNLLNNENGACAQALANRGFAVIAAMSSQPHGHVALVLPGTFSASNSWGGIFAPNSASFRLGSVAQSYVGKALSYAFGATSAAATKYYYREINPFLKQ